MQTIKKVHAREILDSRGNPTVQADVLLQNDILGRASVPSGASTGKFEAVELRDGAKRYLGKGVQKAVENVNKKIAPAILGKNINKLTDIDNIMLKLDASENKQNLGANAILAVSLAAANAAANANKTPLYKQISAKEEYILPVPMMNILNGGAHAGNNVDIQEFMIMPVGAKSFSEGLEWCAEVYHTLAGLLKNENLATAVGDEGGFAPNLATDEKALEYIDKAVNAAGFAMGKDFVFALDAAASEWQTSDGNYRLPKSGKEFTTTQLIDYWRGLTQRWPIASLEDGLGEEDWAGWQQLTAAIGSKVQLVGDDLFVTNTKRLSRGITEKSGNAILIKPNQIGTLSQTLDAIKMAQKAGFRVIISHRSGETEDTVIADIAVATGAGQIKTGAPARSERVAKYNRLLCIEEELAGKAKWAGLKCFG